VNEVGAYFRGQEERKRREGRESAHTLPPFLLMIRCKRGEKSQARPRRLPRKKGEKEGENKDPVVRARK